MVKLPQYSLTFNSIAKFRVSLLCILALALLSPMLFSVKGLGLMAKADSTINVAPKIISSVNTKNSAIATEIDFLGNAAL
jgi:hypothetical protein